MSQLQVAGESVAEQRNTCSSISVITTMEFRTCISCFILPLSNNQSYSLPGEEIGKPVKANSIPILIAIASSQRLFYTLSSFLTETTA
jgi:hypothetical protein